MQCDDQTLIRAHLKWAPPPKKEKKTQTKTKTNEGVEWMNMNKVPYGMSEEKQNKTGECDM